MAYNSNNHKKRVNQIMQVYATLKEVDVPDTRIVRNLLPKHNVHISYRTLMNYKNMKQSALQPQQQVLFG